MKKLPPDQLIIAVGVGSHPAINQVDEQLVRKLHTRLSEHAPTNAEDVIADALLFAFNEFIQFEARKDQIVGLLSTMDEVGEILKFAKCFLQTLRNKPNGLLELKHQLILENRPHCQEEAEALYSQLLGDIEAVERIKSLASRAGSPAFRTYIARNQSLAKQSALPPKFDLQGNKFWWRIISLWRENLHQENIIRAQDGTDAASPLVAFAKDAYEHLTGEQKSATTVAAALRRTLEHFESNSFFRWHLEHDRVFVPDDNIAE